MKRPYLNSDQRMKLVLAAGHSKEEEANGTDSKGCFRNKSKKMVTPSRNLHRSVLIGRAGIFEYIMVVR
jgi:hypothetical protein